MTKPEDQTILDRVNQTYEFLVEETGNPFTLHDKEKDQRLTDLLELFEYLLGNEDETPVPRWFRID